MPSRDLSPAVWTAPGTAKVAMGVVLSSFNNDPLAIDQFLSAYSPNDAQNVNWSSGANTFTIADTTNSRFIFILLPFGNTQTVVLKWNNADTGKYVNPNGFYFDTFDPNNMPTTLYITAGGTINGVKIWVF